jgi:hypothetical protein
MCTFGGFLIYMQLGAALMLHANIQPYILPVFFNASSDMTKSGVNGFSQTYGVWCLIMICMLLGLLIGKRLLLNSVKRSKNYDAKPCIEMSPRVIVFTCCLLQVLVLLIAKSILLKTQLGEMPASTGFVLFAILFGAVNGLLIGICYQAPLFAAQLYFPDRKPAIRSILLFGSTLGLIVYSVLTTYWYRSNFADGKAAAQMIQNLAVSFSAHTVIGSLCISLPTTAFVKKGDKRALQFSLLNTYESDEELKKQQSQMINLYQPSDKGTRLLHSFSDASSDFYENQRR